MQTFFNIFIENSCYNIIIENRKLTLMIDLLLVVILERIPNLKAILSVFFTDVGLI